MMTPIDGETLIACLACAKAKTRCDKRVRHIYQEVFRVNLTANAILTSSLRALDVSSRDYSASHDSHGATRKLSNYRSHLKPP